VKKYKTNKSLSKKLDEELLLFLGKSMKKEFLKISKFNRLSVVFISRTDSESIQEDDIEKFVNEFKLKSCVLEFYLLLHNASFNMMIKFDNSYSRMAGITGLFGGIPVITLTLPDSRVIAIQLNGDSSLSWSELT